MFISSFTFSSIIDVLGLICHLGICFLISPSVLCPSIPLLLPSFGLSTFSYSILSKTKIAQLLAIWVGQDYPCSWTLPLSLKISLHPSFHLVKAQWFSEGCLSALFHSQLSVDCCFALSKALGASEGSLSPSVLSSASGVWRLCTRCKLCRREPAGGYGIAVWLGLLRNPVPHISST